MNHSDEPNPAPVAESVEPAAPAVEPIEIDLATPSDRRRAWIEFGVVAMVGVIPNLTTAVVSFVEPDATSRGSSAASYVAGAAWMLQICVAVLWIMHRSGAPMRRFGIVRPLWAVDLLLGIVLTLLFWATSMGARVVSYGLSAFHPWVGNLRDAVPSAVTDQHFAAPESASGMIAFMAYTALATASEELVLRAYFIPRLAGLLGNAWCGVLLSSVLGASYHIYQGSAAMFEIFFAEILIGLLYVKIRRIWPFIIGHAAYDILLITIYYTP